ncbi:MAG: hypothetical protein Q4G62_10675 [Pseudomonadota bacterium]|nr:hypothetical protein [Pseudomonadota bacterium]
MKITGLIVGLLLSPLALAQSPQSNPKADVEPQPATSPSKQRAEANVSDRHCLRYTGSRITADRERRRTRNPQSANQADTPACAAVAGRAYSREDIERTGAVDLADALRRLDTAFW